MKALFIEQDDANRFINRQWLDLLTPIPLAELDRPQGAFFGSIFATWNHILVGDRIWLARIHRQPAPYTDLRHRIADAMEHFRGEREATDAELIATVGAIEDFTQDLVYQNTRGTSFRTPLYQVLAHLFAHQNHHRGQIHQMCDERSIAMPDGGLIEYYRKLAA
jgi:uncharacterized damage-inducible protein DinB